MEIAIVYPVGGMSSRFGGRIKQFAKVNENETLIEYSLKQALPAGFTKIIFITGEKTEKPFKERFGDNYKGIPVEYYKQEYDKEKRKKPWGTADALCTAKEALDCPFVFCNGDDLYGEDTFRILVEHIKNKDTCAAIGFKLGKVIPEEGRVNRGIFTIKNNFVESLKEVFNIEKNNLKIKNLSEESLCSMNIFALNKDAVEKIDKKVKKFKEENKDNPDVECLLPEELNKLIIEKEITMEIYATPDKWFGITNPGDELIIQKQLKLIK